MYEKETQEAIQSRTLARISDSLDKREGSLIQTAVAPTSVELAQMYVALEGAMNEAFADTATREYLIRRAAERGLTPMLATPAIVKGEFNLDVVSIGSRFACGDFVYVTTERISSGKYKLKCETPGTAANNVTGALLPLVTIPGLTSAELTSVLIYGTDDESTEDFRKRYFDSFNAKSFGGNRADYIEKALSVPGVGAVKVYRASSVAGDAGTSGGNVRLVLLNTAYGIPSADIVASVKNTLDPAANSGMGYGLAPIWHHVHVEAASYRAVNITASVTYETGYSYSTLKTQIEAAVDDYFLSLAKSWQDDTSGLIVRTAYLQSALITIEGILDVSITKLNGASGNLVLGSDEIPKRGVITA